MTKHSTTFDDWAESASAQDTDVVLTIADHIDPLFYSRQIEESLDEKLSALHYFQEGWVRRLNPCANFDTAYYLARSPDVRSAKVNPFYHFLVWGQKEGRRGHPVASNEHPLDGALLEIYNVIEEEFDTEYYLSNVPLARQTHVNPLLHYLWFGWPQGHNPNRDFETNFYLSKNSDVAKAGLNPFYHYLRSGRKEGRRANINDRRVPMRFASPAVAQAIVERFDEQFYLERYSADGVTDIEPLRHYCQFGWRQGNDPSKSFSTVEYMHSHPGRNWEDTNPFVHSVEAELSLKTFEGELLEKSETIRSCTFAIDGCLDVDDTPQALEWLRRSKDAVGGHVAYRQSLRNTIDRIFSDAWIAAEKLYAKSRRDEADVVMTDAARLIANAWATLDPLGCPVRSKPSRRIAVLANVDLRQCTFYRVEQKIDLLTRLGYAVEVYAQDKVESFLTGLCGADAAIFYRLPALPMNIRAIQVAQAMNMPTIYDIDDLIFEQEHYPEPFDTYGDVTPKFYHTLQLGVPLFKFAMSLCDYGMASTTYLAECMKPHVRSGEVFVLKNGLDQRLEDFLDLPVRRTRRDKGLVIFYGSGSKAHNSDFNELASDAIAEILIADPEARLVVAGYASLTESMRALKGQIVVCEWLQDPRDYWALLAEADINIAVLGGYASADAKSEIKWMEAALFGVPSIVSSTRRYKEVLVDGEDAVLAETKADWAKALKRLAGDAEERLRLVTNARSKIRLGYCASVMVRDLGQIFSKVLPRSSEGTGKARVLLVNIFFPPQTIGGSTRVMRDNLDHFLATPSISEAFEFGVVTSDNDATNHFNMRVEDYQGCPVYRICPGTWPNLEWNPYDPEVGALFRRVLEAFRPDLVHFHCPERLSGSIIEETMISNIPYVVSVHDAWWIADYHFLVDERGVLHEPFEPFPTFPPPPANTGRSLDRRRYLQSLLKASQEILSVSDAFTKIYRECGYDRTRTVANGVTPLAPAVRSRSKNKKVRLAHIGSMTHHKGYYLLKDALTKGNFGNIELTVIEHGRFGGDVVTARFGGTEVFFVGKTKQELMHEFYANVDILVAPSIWPESFGLVTREALAAGLWVLASDRGAIGDSITPGVNGWVIDVSDETAMMRVLKEIDDDPSTYTKSPPSNVLALRSAADQSEELVEIYRSVLARPLERRGLSSIALRKRIKPQFTKDILSLDPVQHSRL